MLKLIYIAGYGRSGSTILDIVLGQHESVFGMGELSTMCRHVWARNEYCACGTRIHECAFWEPVMSDWLSSGVDPTAHLWLQRQIEPLYTPLRRSGSAALRRYLAQTEVLLETVAARARTPILLDSSKMPGRGLAFSMSNSIDLRVIHLVRDGRAVAHSMTRAMGIDVAKGRQKEIKARSTYRTALRWRLYNSAVEALAQRVGHDRFVRVRYEDLMADTPVQLQRIGRCVELDLSDLGGRISMGEPISSVHQMAGSRIRMEGRLKLEADTRWETEITEANRRRVFRIAGGQLRRYGYLAQP